MNDQTANAVPNPGSADALARGCTCPVHDNHGGAGFTLLRGQPSWWITDGCPLHAPAQALFKNSDVASL